MTKNFVILLRPPVVGKMTVGQELSTLTNYQLFHNHLIIEALLPIFAFESMSFKKLCTEFRTKIFKQIVENNQISPNLDNSGLIFTYVGNYKSKDSLSNLLNWLSLFEQANFGIYIVELIANLAERLERNKSINRVNHKASKRDITKSM